jgi:hypothetical protein
VEHRSRFTRVGERQEHGTIRRVDCRMDVQLIGQR